MNGQKTLINIIVSIFMALTNCKKQTENAIKIALLNVRNMLIFQWLTPTGNCASDYYLKYLFAVFRG